MEFGAVEDKTLHTMENLDTQPSALTFCSIVKVEADIKEEVDDLEYCIDPQRNYDPLEEAPAAGPSASIEDLTSCNINTVQSQDFWRSLLGSCNQNEVKIEPQSPYHSESENQETSEESRLEFSESDNSSDEDWKNEEKVVKKNTGKSIKQAARKILHASPKIFAKRPPRSSEQDSGQLFDTFQSIAYSFFPKKNAEKIQKTLKVQGVVDLPKTDQNLAKITEPSSSEEKMSIKSFPMSKLQADKEHKTSSSKRPKTLTHKTSTKKFKTENSDQRVPFNCVLCGENFKDRTSFKIHWQRFKFFQCSNCLLTFSSKFCCTKHIDYVHGGEAEANFGVFHASSVNPKKSETTNCLFQCNQCPVILETEVMVFDHVRRMHQDIYKSFNELGGISSRNSFNGEESWSSKTTFREAFVNIKKEEEANARAAIKWDMTSEFVNLFTHVKFSRGKLCNNPVKLNCELCSELFSDDVSHIRHLREIHKITAFPVSEQDAVPNVICHNKSGTTKEECGQSNVKDNAHEFEYKPDVSSLILNSSQSSSESSTLGDTPDPTTSKTGPQVDELLFPFELGNLFGAPLKIEETESHVSFTEDEEDPLNFLEQESSPLIIPPLPRFSILPTLSVKYQCPICNNLLANELNLRRHIRGNHMGIDMLTMKICESVSKVVQNQSSLLSEDGKRLNLSRSRKGIGAKKRNHK